MGMHVIWLGLFLFIMLKPDVPQPLHERKLTVVSQNTTWWSFDDTTQTLRIHAKKVTLGEPLILKKSNLKKFVINE